MSRRERLRAQTLQEIEDASFSIIDADGTHALSIAALARSMDMSAPGVYRYFPSREALLAHLIHRSYQQLATAIGQALEGGGRTAPRIRVRLLVAAYRDWALQYGNRYGMLFGRRIGDVPADDGARTPLDQAMGQLLDLLLALPDGSPAQATSGDRTLDGQLQTWSRAQQRPGTPPRTARTAIVIWTRVHGIVSLELTGMLDGQAVDVQRLIDLEIDNAIQLLTSAGP
jgi:AcrR family transcriptional regulator